MNPETIYLQQLESIERIAAFVARRKHLNADETEEFTQVVRVKLFEDDYAIIRKFEGRSRITTYLTTVILHLCNQWRVEMWGKWRPSAEARRLGDKAINLERLITRDGFTFAEAVKTLTTRSGGVYTVAELEALYVCLPLRNPRPVLVSDDDAPEVAAPDADTGHRAESRDRECSARRCAAALDDALARYGPEDRLILQLRFWDAKKVPDIARIVGIDQKKIYKRLDKLFRELRVALEKAGVHQSDVEQWLCGGDQEIRLNLLPPEESTPFRPSNPPGGEMRGGDRRVR
ncbi:MAG TPA: sigma-70 family RNA polymerase sigma factor [Thermoanaerobaculia bacterium]